MEEGVEVNLILLEVMKEEEEANLILLEVEVVED